MCVTRVAEPPVVQKPLQAKPEMPMAHGSASGLAELAPCWESGQGTERSCCWGERDGNEANSHLNPYQPALRGPGHLLGKGNHLPGSREGSAITLIPLISPGSPAAAMGCGGCRRPPGTRRALSCLHRDPSRAPSLIHRQHRSLNRAPSLSSSKSSDSNDSSNKTSKTFPAPHPGCAATRSPQLASPGDCPRRGTGCQDTCIPARPRVRAVPRFLRSHPFAWLLGVYGARSAPGGGRGALGSWGGSDDKSGPSDGWDGDRVSR